MNVDPQTRKEGPLLLPTQEIDPKDYHVGVIVARFQVSSLTPAHEALIDYMTSRHGKQLILLGVPLTQGEMPNPLDYGSREQMIKTQYPNAVVLPILDVPNDNVAWSRDVDKAVFIAFGREHKALLYGSRESFIPSYFGRNVTQQLDTTHSEISGTQSRDFDSRVMQNSPDWRAGNIHAIAGKRPVSWLCADVVGFSPEGLALFGQKPIDKGLWRFIGGFKDVPDHTVEETAIREFWEETGKVCRISDPKYVASQNIDNARYRGTVHTITTLLFVGRITEDTLMHLKPSDDVSGLAWINLQPFIDGTEKVEDFIIPEHVELFGRLVKAMNTPISLHFKIKKDASVTYTAPVISLEERFGDQAFAWENTSTEK